uniref:hypothetical protein n=1 Tax=Psychrobacter sp. TaxID=56811 RepID=UPI0015EEF70E|nr:hypothetical protein [Psychrobacter sp.]
MSTYIEEARRQLAQWAENIDIDTFTEQYESLNHGSGGMLLEDERIDKHYQSLINGLESHETIDRAYNSILLVSISSEVGKKTNNEMMEDYFASLTESRVSRGGLRKIEPRKVVKSYSSFYYDGNDFIGSRRVDKDEFDNIKQMNSLKVA